MKALTMVRPGWAWLGILAVLLARAVLADAPATQSSTQPSTEPTAAPPTPQVLALVDDLTSDQFAVRQKAQRDLEQMGPAVIPQLREILDGQITDEVRTRIGAAINRIGDVQQFGATVITIHCTDAPLEGVLQDFAHQAGADMGIYRPEIRGYLQSHKITLNLQRADFWSALQAVEDGSGLHRRPDNDGRLILDNQIGFWGGQMGDLARAKIVGPCLIVPVSLQSSMQYDANYSSNLSIQLSVMIEPKMRTVGSIPANWLRECVDDKGHSLIPPAANEGFFYNGGPQQWIRTLTANLRRVPQMGTKIARLKGELDFNVQTKSELVTIDNILSAKNVVRNIAGSAITVQQFRNDGGQFELTMLISGPLAAPNSEFLQTTMTSEFRILDDNNQQLQQVGASQSNDGLGRATITLHYMANAGWRPPNAQPIGPPKKLQYEVATETRPMTERFEFDDLPLVPPEGPNR